jgi:hypothetical protein
MYGLNQNTYCWKVAKREDTQQTGLSTSAIADYDQFPAKG